MSHPRCPECGCPLTSEEEDICDVCSEYLEYVDDKEYWPGYQPETENEDE